MPKFENILGFKVYYARCKCCWRQLFGHNTTILTCWFHVMYNIAKKSKEKEPFDKIIKADIGLNGLPFLNYKNIPSIFTNNGYVHNLISGNHIIDQRDFQPLIFQLNHLTKKLKNICKGLRQTLKKNWCYEKIID